MTAAIASPPAPPPEVRHAVANMLTRSDAFRAMPLEAQKEIAQNTNKVLGYLARPEGIDGNRIPGGIGMPAAGALAEDTDHSATEGSWADHKAAVDDIGKGKFKANAAREAANVAGLLLNQVKFPTFVSGLIQGVFQSITDSSIQQMHAYQDMIASVAKSLHEFTDDNVTPNQGRDHMVDQFPDLFEIGMDEDSDTPSPKLKLKDGVDENEALKKVNNKLEFENGALKSLDLSDENVENALVENSRLQLARQRQQLLASIVLMGINRIVVTDGKISAKIIYDVKAQDNLAKRRSATAVDVARDQAGNVQQTWSGEGKYDDSSKSGTSGGDYSAEYYAKGEYKYDSKPVITAQTAASESSTAALQTKIQLSGAVDVNFKSDYLPLDKMATPQMIATIQGNATPADPNLVPSARAAPAAPAAGAPASPPAAAAIAPAPAR
jgi:hypothetical protein